MAGLTAAASCARHGARVLLLERAAEIGGSAALSGGYVWSVPDLPALLRADPGADPARGEALLSGLPAALDWVASHGISLGPRRGPRAARLLGLGHGHRIDVVGYLRRCAALVEASGGHIITRCVTSSLILDGQRVQGVVARDATGSTVRLGGAWTILATGGFQGDAGLVREHLGASSAAPLRRANPVSDGAGLRLALSAGAETTARMDGFYGHLVAAPADRFDEPDFIPLAQFYSDRSILVDYGGTRFTDERLGDHINAQATMARAAGRAVLVLDERLRQTVASEEGYDKLAAARRRGARVCTAANVDELVSTLAGWGVDPVGTARTLADATSPGPGSGDGNALTSPPFHAVDVRPAITFTYGGARTDPDGRVHARRGGWVDGLLAAGADAAGLYGRGYAGGLSMALVTGLRAAATATSQR